MKVCSLAEGTPGDEGQRTGALLYNLAQAARPTAAQGSAAGVLEGQGAGEPLAERQAQEAKRFFWEPGRLVGTCKDNSQRQYIWLLYIS